MLDVGESHAYLIFIFTPQRAVPWLFLRKGYQIINTAFHNYRFVSHTKRPRLAPKATVLVWTVGTLLALKHCLFYTTVDGGFCVIHFISFC